MRATVTEEKTISFPFEPTMHTHSAATKKRAGARAITTDHKHSPCCMSKDRKTLFKGEEATSRQEVCKPKSAGETGIWAYVKNQQFIQEFSNK